MFAPKQRKRNLARPSVTDSQISAFGGFDEPSESTSINITNFSVESSDNPSKVIKLQGDHDLSRDKSECSSEQASLMTDFFTAKTAERTNYINDLFLKKTTEGLSLSEYEEVNSELKHRISSLRIISVQSAKSTPMPSSSSPIFSTVFAPGIVPHPEKRIVFMHTGNEVLGMSGSLKRGTTPIASLEKNMPFMITSISSFSGKDWLALGCPSPDVWVYDYNQMRFVQHCRQSTNSEAMTTAVQANLNNGLIAGSLDNGQVVIFDPRMCGHCSILDPETKEVSTSIDTSGESLLQCSNGKGFLWDLRNGKYIQHDCGANKDSFLIGKIVNGDNLIVFGKKGEKKLSFWNSNTGNQVDPIEIENGLSSLSYCSSLNEILVSSNSECHTNVSVLKAKNDVDPLSLYDCAELPQNLVDCSVNSSGSLFTARSIGTPPFELTRLKLNEFWWNR